MRDFYFYTNRPITAKDCFDLWWRSYRMGWIWFYNDKFEDYANFYENKEELEAEKNLIPIKDPYINFFEAYRSTDVKRVLKVLMCIYPELYVSAEEDDPVWYGTAQEYIDTQFDY